MHYRPPWWLPEGHSQTVWSALLARPARALAGSTVATAWRPRWQRERWDTPDQDFVDVDRQSASRPQRPWLVLFHGLEGSSSSH